jgi:hypothetical protein
MTNRSLYLLRFLKHRSLFLVLAVVVALLTAYRISGDTVADGTGQPRAWRSIHVGMTEDRVRAILGSPTESLRGASNQRRWGISGPKGYRYLEVTFGPPSGQAIIVQEYRYYRRDDYSLIVRCESICFKRLAAAGPGCAYPFPSKP